MDRVADGVSGNVSSQNFHTPQKEPPKLLKIGVFGLDKGWEDQSLLIAGEQNIISTCEMTALGTLLYDRKGITRDLTAKISRLL